MSKTTPKGSPPETIRNRTSDPMAAVVSLAGKPASVDQAGKPASSGGAMTVEEMVRRSNFWRDNYNPLRGLTIARLMALFEQAERGAFAEIQLTLRKAEKRFPVLKGFIERLLSSIEELDWDVKVMEELPPGATPEMAETQRAWLKSRYELISNLSDAMGQIALAEVRGYAVLQKRRYQDGPNAGAVCELYWLEPWRFVRDGFYGDFYFNDNSQFGVGLGSCDAILGPDNRLGSDSLPRGEFIIREVNAPLYEIALIAFVNWLMGRKDFAAFTEVFGLAKGVVIMPPGIPPEKAAEYEASARQVSDGVAGALPNGSNIVFPTAGVRGESPFEKYCEAQDKDLVMAATSGMLSMLQGSSGGGLNQGPHKEHGDAWDTIAKMKGKRVNETLQQDFDAPELAAQFPGQPVCVYFSLAVQDEKDAASICTSVAALQPGGLEPDLDWLNAVTGYKFVQGEKPQPMPFGPGNLPPADPSAPRPPALVTNRDGRTPTAADYLAAVAEDLQPFLKAFSQRMENILAIADPAVRQARFEKAWSELAPLRADIAKDPASAHVLAQMNTQALVTGLTDPHAPQKS